MSSQYQVMSFECYDLFIGITKYINFMITYILQYEIPLQMKFINLGHDLLFWVMTQLTSYHPIGTYNLYMSSQCYIISHLNVMTHLFDLPNALNS